MWFGRIGVYCSCRDGSPCRYIGPDVAACIGASRRPGCKAHSRHVPLPVLIGSLNRPDSSGRFCFWGLFAPAPAEPGPRKPLPPVNGTPAAGLESRAGAQAEADAATEGAGAGSGRSRRGIASAARNANPSATADSAKAIVKPVSVGKPVAETTVPATTLAAI